MTGRVTQRQGPKGVVQQGKQQQHAAYKVAAAPAGAIVNKSKGDRQANTLGNYLGAYTYSSLIDLRYSIGCNSTSRIVCRPSPYDSAVTGRMRRERPLEVWKPKSIRQRASRCTCTRRCDMPWKELLNLGAGGVGGRRGGRRREGQGAQNAWQVFQPPSTSRAPLRPPAAKEGPEYSPPAPSSSLPPARAPPPVRPAVRPAVTVMPPRLTGNRLMNLPILDSFLQQTTHCGDCLETSVRRVVRREISQFAGFLEAHDGKLTRAPALARSYLS
jgi:hypothetical protein